MSSAMVSSYLDYTAERLHTDFSEYRLLEEPNSVAQNTSGLEGIDLPLSSQFIPAGVGSARPPLSRRHSSSLFNGNNLKMLPPGLSTFPEANAAMLTLDTVAEDRFRSRAFSEGSSILSNESLQDQQTAASRYKTELCRPYEENGKCKYGDKCQFAHGKHEVRHVVRHPKYKTELCRTYHTSGICPYGPRCHFIHNQEDSTALRQAIINERSALARQCSVPVPISNATPRNPIVQRSVSHRPGNLQLLSQMRSNLNRTSSYGSYSPPNVISSPLGASPPYFIGEPALSPLTSATSGQFFSSNKAPMSPMELPRTSSFGSAVNFPEQQRQTPPMAPIDLFTQGSQFLESCPSTTSDDGVFDGPPTPPDSDRESNTGSPHAVTNAAVAANGSRLAIFRCLSQSEQ